MPVEPHFKTLYFNQHARLLRVAYSITKDRFVAEDVVQDVFLKLWRTQIKLSEIQSPEAYLIRMTKNEALNCLDRARKESEILLTVKEEAVSMDEKDNNVYEEFRQSLERGVALLPPQCRLIFTLSRFEGLSNDEIATYLNISKRTVETQISVALKMFRSELKSILKSHLTSFLPILAFIFLG